MFLIDSSAWIEYLRPKGSRTVKERVRAKLLDYEAIVFVTALFQDSEASLPREAVMRMAHFLAQERHSLLSSLAGAVHDFADWALRRAPADEQHVAFIGTVGLGVGKARASA
jgi:predicted nucleic acid-binding protein